MEMSTIILSKLIPPIPSSIVYEKILPHKETKIKESIIFTI